MTEISLQNKLLKEFLKCCQAVNRDIIIVFNEQEMQSIVNDPANVMMCDIKLISSAFNEYNVSEKTIIYVDSKKITDVLRLLSDDINVQIKAREDRITISASGLIYTFGTLGISGIKLPELPAIEPPAQVILKGSEFEKMCEAAEKVSKHITLGVQDDTFFVFAKDESNEMKWEIIREKLIDMKVAEAKSLFSLEYLNAINKTYQKNYEIKLEIGVDYPLKLSFDIANGFGTCVFYLAPRIEEE